MNRLLPCGAMLLALTCSAARAETVVVRPDPCPKSANQPLIIDLGDVETFTEHPARTLGRVLVIYPPVRDGWASARLLMRFDLDAPGSPAGAQDCLTPKMFRMPG